MSLWNFFVIKNVKAYIKSFFTSFSFLVCFVMFLRVFVIDYSVVPSESMTKTLCTGNFVLVNKMVYKIYSPVAIPVIGRFFARNVIMNNKNIKRGDIIVFSHRDDGGKYFTKRVVGLPGDVVEYDDREVVINGESTMFNPDGSPIFDQIEDFEFFHDDNQREIMEKRICRIPTGDGNKYRIINTIHGKVRRERPRVKYRVPDGYLFFVGDNRDHSYDSRSHPFGDAQTSYVSGRLSYRVFGTKARFKRDVSWLQFIVELAYRVLRYVISIDFSIFGNLNSDICDVNDKTAVNNIINSVLKVGPNQFL